MKKHMAHHGKKHHTGPIHHADMHDHLPAVEDGHLHESHKAGNKEHGGAGHMMGDDDGDEGMQKGGKGMGSNCSYE